MPFCKLIKFHKMREVHVINAVFSLMSSAFREGTDNAGGMRGREKGSAPYNPT